MNYNLLELLKKKVYKIPLNNKPFKLQRYLLFHGVFYFVITLAVLIIASLYSFGFIQADEHFQIVEFARLKLGDINEQDLAWEYGAKIRPWLQPLLYFTLFNFLKNLNIESSLDWMFFSRVLTSLFASFTVATVYYGLYKSESKKVFYDSVKYFPFIFTIPLLFVRGSSENYSALTFWFSVFLYLGVSKNGLKNYSLYFLFGFLLGISFQFRFQMALMISGLGLWLVIFKKITFWQFLSLSIGFLLCTVLGVLIDFWGYGELTFTPWNYLKVNILEGKANEFGKDPWWSYFFLYIFDFYVLGFFFLFIIILHCFKYPSHIFSWSIFYFIIIHFFISHKETRFLFPAFYILIPMALRLNTDLKKWIRNKKWMRNSFRIGIKIFWIINIILFIYWIFIPFDKNFGVINYIANNFKNEKVIYYNYYHPYKAKNTIPMEFYAKDNPEMSKINSLEEFIRLEGKKYLVYFTYGYSDTPVELKSCALTYETIPVTNMKIGKKRIIKWMNRIYYEYFRIYQCDSNSKE